MKPLLYRLFINSWPRKLIAVTFAIMTWFLVNETISVTRTIPNVPVRIINLPADKTVVGLLPNGFLKYRISITITGTKSIVNELRPNDLEVVINAEGKKESWIATIDKKDLVNFNGEKEWKKAISSVTANDLYIKVSRLVTDEVPLTINKPIGDPPQGYQFLDIWPKYLTQKVSGPQEQVQTLKEYGLEVTFNLNRITKTDLDALYNSSRQDEVSFFVPESWKMVTLPFKGNTQEPFNDPRAKLLRIDFLKQDLVPLGIELPITIFFPVKHSLTINPQTYSLLTNEIVVKKNGLKLLNIPLYVRDASRLFLDVVRDHLLLTIIAAPNTPGTPLKWAVELINEQALEQAYVLASLKEGESIHKDNEMFSKYNEQAIRNRFWDYRRQLKLYTEGGQPLNLKSYLDINHVVLEKQ
ncbi:MAG: hypothetical protein JSS62_07095 [Verrucomicrobia bacterium]|nr:hypothetical protein [Verrucomicrobiota bacterium]MBS0646729.1 hypothetical protein [Verrucomicrobiota bacterium]